MIVTDQWNGGYFRKRALFYQLTQPVNDQYIVACTGAAPVINSDYILPVIAYIYLIRGVMVNQPEPVNRTIAVRSSINIACAWPWLLAGLAGIQDILFSFFIFCKTSRYNYNIPAAVFRIICVAGRNLPIVGFCVVDNQYKEAKQ